MKEELKSLTIRLQVSNMRTENLMDNITKTKNILNEFKNLLSQELEISNNVANKIKLELLMEEAGKAQNL